MAALNLPGLIPNKAHPLARGLAGWWPLNEGGGDRVSDISGRGNHGLWLGSPKWGGSPHGNAPNLDGSNDYASIPDSASITMPGDMTACAWVTLQSASSYRVILAKRFSTGTAEYEIYLNGTSLRWWDGAERISGYTMPLNVPQFVLCTRVSGVIGFYVNGQFIASVVASNPSVAQPLRIGADTAGQYINAQIYGVRLWNRPLHQSEIWELAQGPTAGALSPRGVSRCFVPPRPVVPPPVVTATGGVNYNQARQAWIRREDEELIIIHGRHP